MTKPVLILQIMPTWFNTLLFNSPSSSIMVAIALIGAKRIFCGRTPPALRFPKKFSESSKRVSLMIGTKTDCLD